MDVIHNTHCKLIIKHLGIKYYDGTVIETQLKRHRVKTADWNVELSIL